MRMTEILRTANDVKPLLKEKLAYYILEWWNAEEAENRRGGYSKFRVHQQTFLRDMHDAYRDDATVDAFSSAWQWLVERNYIAVAPGTGETLWHRLTEQGRKITSHKQWQPASAAHDSMPSGAPNFAAVVSDAALAAHLRVLWREADLTYNGGAYLATEILLGAILEGALLAKAQGNQAAARGATAAPKGRRIEQWSLANLIEVASEVGWIHKTRGQFSDIVRDHRNFVHPLKVSTTGSGIDKGAAGIAWKVVVETLRDLGIS